LRQRGDGQPELGLIHAAAPGLQPLNPAFVTSSKTSAAGKAKLQALHSKHLIDRFIDQSTNRPPVSTPAPIESQA
jgi:hypothetical protein